MIFDNILIKCSFGWSRGFQYARWYKWSRKSSWLWSSIKILWNCNDS